MLVLLDYSVNDCHVDCLRMQNVPDFVFQDSVKGMVNLIYTTIPTNLNDLNFNIPSDVGEIVIVGGAHCLYSARYVPGSTRGETPEIVRVSGAVGDASPVLLLPIRLRTPWNFFFSCGNALRGRAK